MEIISTKSKVRKLLEDRPHLRDDDRRLIANIWYKDADMIMNKGLSAIELLDLFISKKLTNPEAIRRSRQQLQEEHPELRGESYKERKKHTKSVKKQLKIASDRDAAQLSIITNTH